MPRIKLTVAYVGTAYHGWQTQARKDKYVPTVQTVLMRAAAGIVRSPVHVHGAGRTDAGVHADAQVAHMDVPENRAHIDWQMALNTSLPHDIRIVRAERVPDSFHAQHSAVRKTYRYMLWQNRHYTPPRLYPFVWTCGPVDTSLMETACQHLMGTRDFASLRNAGTDVLTTVRKLSCARRLHPHEAPSEWITMPEASLWQFEADGFLKQMVRNIMGLLVAVGRCKLDVDALPAVLEARNRADSAATAPASGLTLHRVWYADDLPPSQG